MSKVAIKLTSLILIFLIFLPNARAEDFVEEIRKAEVPNAHIKDKNFEAYEEHMITRPMDRLRGNCFGGCKTGLCKGNILPERVLRQSSGTALEVRENSKKFNSHEGIFSDDLYYRPYAYVPLFEKLGLTKVEIEGFLAKANAIDVSKKINFNEVMDLRKFLYPVVANALIKKMEKDNGATSLPSSMFKLDTLIGKQRDTSRESFYKAVVEYKRKNLNKTLEFWNPKDKEVYNLVFGEFNYAWMAILDIFESDEFNPGYKNFQRIYPVKKEDLGKQIFEKNEKPADGVLSVDIRDIEQFPDGTIVIYRAGSLFTSDKCPQKGETYWGDSCVKVSSLWGIDNTPGHIECVFSDKKNERIFCSDGKKCKPATEWKNKDREILAIYKPVA